MPNIESTIQPIRPQQRTQGFTVIELMVVVSVIAILAMVSVPGFQAVLDNYRVRRATEDLVATIYLARTEAIKHGGEVVLRKSVPAGCAGSSTTAQWECGWFVFLDLNNNNLLDGPESVIQASPIATGVDIRFTSNHAVMPIDRWGQFNGSGAFGFIVKSSRTASSTQPAALCMTSGGRLATKAGATSCQS